MGGRATDSGLDKRSGSAGRGASAGVGMVLGGRATDSGLDKRSGGAGRGASAGVGVVVGGRATVGRHGSAGRITSAYAYSCERFG